MFLSRYNILGAVALGKAKNEKAAAKILFDIVGLETEKYRLGHTKVWKIFEFCIQSYFFICLAILYCTWSIYLVYVFRVCSGFKPAYFPFRKINYCIYSVAKWFRVHFKNVEGFGYWHYTHPDAFFPIFVWCHAVMSYGHFIVCLCSVLNMM